MLKINLLKLKIKTSCEYYMNYMLIKNPLTLHFS